MIFRTLRAKLPRFEAGISKHNVEIARETLRKLDYCGPVALSWDDTALEQALSVWDEGGDTFTILGCSDGPIRVSSAAAVDAIFEDKSLAKADKVRLRLLSVICPWFILIIVVANLLINYPFGEGATCFGRCCASGIKVICRVSQGHTL